MRKILHMDIDAFFAQVEQMDHPEYKGKPVIIGGTSDRGVVATASYEARKYGIHSAMPSFRARKLCPDGIFLRGDFNRYQELSKAVFGIVSHYSDKVEKVSIDEAYLDVTDHESAYQSAVKLKKHIKDEVGLTVSVGVSYNKFLAKLASDWNKPDGIKVIGPEDLPEILKPLPIKKVHGLGKKSVQRLNKIGIFTIDDLLQYSEDFLIQFLGSYGKTIYQRIRGIDDRPVEMSGERKSIGKETTLKVDTLVIDDLSDHLMRFAVLIAKTLSKRGWVAYTVTVKLKTEDFESHTRSKTLNIYVSEAHEIYGVALELLKSKPLPKPIRLIGLSTSTFEEKDHIQLTFSNDLFT